MCTTGYYKLSAKIAMITQFPDLIELEGENRIVQADSYGEDVRGFTEFLGVTIVNETDMVGVQKSKTTLSQITSNKNGQALTVSWVASGAGGAGCCCSDVTGLLAVGQAVQPSPPIITHEGHMCVCWHAFHTVAALQKRQDDC